MAGKHIKERNCPHCGEPISTKPWYRFNSLGFALGICMKCGGKYREPTRWGVLQGAITVGLGLLINFICIPNLGKDGSKMDLVIRMLPFLFVGRIMAVITGFFIQYIAVEEATTKLPIGVYCPACGEQIASVTQRILYGAPSGNRYMDYGRCPYCLAKYRMHIQWRALDLIFIAPGVCVFLFCSLFSDYGGAIGIAAMIFICGPASILANVIGCFYIGCDVEERGDYKRRK